MSGLALTLWADGPWQHQPLIRWSLTAAYLLVLLLIATYGLHRYWLVALYYRTRHKVPPPGRLTGPLPRVTVQLPMYNEGNVAARIIDAACRLDYPGDKLQIQVLDDSTDDSARLAARRVASWAERGVDIQILHRARRVGYKAGALADALPLATGQFIAVFDADFVPPANFLLNTIHHFADDRIGMVQTRWDHLNRDLSLLTRSQAIFLDGHFVIEHAARNRSGRWINFNGTAGIWRRQAILDAGNWQHDTLTEDVDLSYRAQLAGWRFLFLPDVTCPAELPPEINAFKAQQHRWTKGSIQTAKKLLPALMRSDAPARVKVEAFFHLTSPMVYLYVTLMVLMFYPAMLVNMAPFEDGTVSALVIGMSLFALGTASASAFYVASQRAQGRSVWATIAKIPMLMSIGIGIALNNARGCVEALLGHESAFVRTPKYNLGGTDGEQRSRVGPERIIATPSIKLWMSLLEVAMGCYVLHCAWRSLDVDFTVVSLPFLLLFASGYLYVGLTSLFSQWSVRRPLAKQVAAAV